MMLSLYGLNAKFARIGTVQSTTNMWQNAIVHLLRNGLLILEQVNLIDSLFHEQLGVIFLI